MASPLALLKKTPPAARLEIGSLFRPRRSPIPPPPARWKVLVGAVVHLGAAGWLLSDR